MNSTGRCSEKLWRTQRRTSSPDMSGTFQSSSSRSKLCRRSCLTSALPPENGWQIWPAADRIWQTKSVWARSSSSTAIRTPPDVAKALLGSVAVMSLAIAAALFVTTFGALGIGGTGRERGREGPRLHVFPRGARVVRLFGGQGARQRDHALDGRAAAREVGRGIAKRGAQLIGEPWHLRRARIGICLKRRQRMRIVREVQSTRWASKPSLLLCCPASNGIEVALGLNNILSPFMAAPSTACPFQACPARTGLVHSPGSRRTFFGKPPATTV